MATASVPNPNFVNGTPADADQVDANNAALVTFLNNQVVHRDGSKAMGAAFDAGGFKVSNVAAGTAASDAVTKTQAEAFAGLGITSSTRPGSPVEGQQIYETDSDFRYEYNGSSWVPTPGQLIFHGSGSQLSVASTKSVLVIDTSIRDSGLVEAPGFGKLQAPRTGLYSLHFAHSATGSPSASQSLVAEVTTGDLLASTSELRVAGNNTGALRQGSGFVQLDTGDQLTLYLDSSSTSSVATYSFNVRLYLVAV